MVKDTESEISRPNLQPPLLLWKHLAAYFLRVMKLTVFRRQKYLYHLKASGFPKCHLNVGECWHKSRLLMEGSKILQGEVMMMTHPQWNPCWDPPTDQKIQSWTAWLGWQLPHDRVWPVMRILRILHAHNDHIFSLKFSTIPVWEKQIQQYPDVRVNPFCNLAGKSIYSYVKYY